MIITKGVPDTYQTVLFCIRGHKVIFWEGYGVVCPTLWTTNGSSSYVAGLVSSHVAHDSSVWAITDAVFETDFSNKEALLLALRTAWDQFKDEVKKLRINDPRP